MKSGIALVLMLPSFALAQTQTDLRGPATATPATTGTEATPTAASQSTMAKGHNCGRNFYPAAAIAAREEGTVGLSFRIDIDGSTKNIVVTSTSGFPDLDQAAVVCAAQWKYRPAMRDGQPVAVNWASKVRWMLGAAPVSVNANAGSPPTNAANFAQMQQPIGSHICKYPLAPPASLGKSTAIMFRVMQDGSVENLRIARSSGEDELDRYGLACVGAWRFTTWTGSTRERRAMLVTLPW